MKKSMKKILAMLLVVMSIVPLFTMFAVPSSAASTTAYDILTTSRYAKVYTLNRSGRVTPYTSSSLTYRGTVSYGRSSSAYIDCRSDELYLCDVGRNSRGTYYAYVSYPSGSRRVYAYIPLSAISSNNASHTKSVSTGKFYVSYRQGVGTSSSYYVAKGDTVYLLNKNGSQYQILYPTSGNKYRIGFCSSSDYNRYCTGSSNSGSGSASTSSSAWEYPMRNAYCTWRSYRNMSWGSYNNNSGNRDYHLGIDIYGTAGKVYAASAGEIVAYSNSNRGANGRYVIIKHNVQGKTVYSFYAHLSSLTNVYKGKKVTTNTQIGVAGGSGYGRNYYYGTHLHFAIIDSLNSSGGYYGYAPYFSGNKVTYSGRTFYNPQYVIQYDRLP